MRPQGKFCNIFGGFWHHILHSRCTGSHQDDGKLQYDLDWACYCAIMFSFHQISVIPTILYRLSSVEHRPLANGARPAGMKHKVLKFEFS